MSEEEKKTATGVMLEMEEERQKMMALQVSRRDWFAGKAMQAMINKLSENPIFQVQPEEDIDPEKVSEQLKPGEVYYADPDSIEIVTPSYEGIAERAYEIADAMLEERENNGH